MYLIIGGAYQGKLDYAKEKHGIRADDIFYCDDSQMLDTRKRCIHGYEKYLRACSREKKAPVTEFPPDTVVICRDIFCGIVPSNEADRAWRELTGRTISELAKRADTVTRIFCGIPTILKDAGAENAEKAE